VRYGLVVAFQLVQRLPQIKERRRLLRIELAGRFKLR
jgi:hypothetical protein